MDEGTEADGYTDDLLTKYKGIVLLTQYKLSYTREFRIQVLEIQAAIDHVYKQKFHKKQFFLTGTFSFVYVLCLFTGFFLI